jgi:hypothetical protein
MDELYKVKMYLNERENELKVLRSTSRNKMLIAEDTNDIVLVNMASETVIRIDHALEELKLLREEFDLESVGKYPLRLDDIVVATYGHNKVLDEPFKFLYEFGYYANNFKNVVVYKKGERSMQDSYSYPIDAIEKATADDLRELSWGN